MADDFDIGALLKRFSSHSTRIALVHKNHRYSYGDLLERYQYWNTEFARRDLSGRVIGLAANYSLDVIAVCLALWSRAAIVALLPQAVSDSNAYVDAGHLHSLLRINDQEVDDQGFDLTECSEPATHELLLSLQTTSRPGLILFSSGSTGAPKAILHDFNRFLGKYVKPGKALATIAFLVFDHVAGQDTLLYTLAAGGTLIIPETRRPAEICALIDAHSAEVLPTSPSFLNLMLVSGIDKEHDLDSLKIVTYGSEPMSESTLRRLANRLPDTKIIQKYGTTEFGALRSKSRSNSSLYIDLKADESQYKIVDGQLWIKARGTMLGYLNADYSLEDGWFCTGDLVEQDGRWLKILGRASDLINVGGEKVVPAEVEAVILELDYVADATVSGETNALMGMVVTAVVAVDGQARKKPARDVTKAIRGHCRERLASYKVPVKIRVEASPVVTDRQKKQRRAH